MDKETIKEKILEKDRENKICIMTIEGIACTPIEDFINQPVEGLLYDLNRDEATVLTLIDDPKWINDFACNRVIKYLYNKLKEYES